jgi:hypothetical protein
MQSQISKTMDTMTNIATLSSTLINTPFPTPELFGAERYYAAAPNADDPTGFLILFVGAALLWWWVNRPHR